MCRYFLIALSSASLVLTSFSGCKIMMASKQETKTPNAIATIQSMNEIEASVIDADLVVFDIDHTILEAKTNYCHANWFYDHWEDAVKHGVSEHDALAALLPSWEASQKHCQVKAVESITPQLIKKYQANGKKVMALTTRARAIADDTLAQLSSLGVDFSKSAPAIDTDTFFDGVYTKNGVVFTTDYKAKGDVLKDYLARAGVNAKNIVFVDDSMANLISVNNVLGHDGTTVHAFFYPRVKRDAASWNKAKADAEWEKRHGKIVYGKKNELN